MLPPIGCELSFSLEVIERRQQSSEEHRQGNDVSDAGACVALAVVEVGGGARVAAVLIAADADQTLHLSISIICIL